MPWVRHGNELVIYDDTSLTSARTIEAQGTLVALAGGTMALLGTNGVIWVRDCR
jgi:hypothetical protein